MGCIELLLYLSILLLSYNIDYTEGFYKFTLIVRCVIQILFLGVSCTSPKYTSIGSHFSLKISI